MGKQTSGVAADIMGWQDQLGTLTPGLLADIMGWQDQLGTLTPGLLADILVVDGDPLENLCASGNVALVIKGGAIVVDNLA